MVDITCLVAAVKYSVIEATLLVRAVRSVINTTSLLTAFDSM